MALHTLSLARSNVLDAVKFYPPNPVGVSVAATNLSPTDLASIATSIINDTYPLSGGGGIVTTGDTHTNTTLDNIVTADAAKVVAMKAAGAVVLVCGQGIYPGTFVVSIVGTTATLSHATTATAATVAIMFVPLNQGSMDRFDFNGQLHIPRRGTLQLLPGDVVATDRITGWPILVSAAAIAASGSWWTYT